MGLKPEKDTLDSPWDTLENERGAWLWKAQGEVLFCWHCHIYQEKEGLVNDKIQTIKYKGN